MGLDLVYFDGHTPLDEEEKEGLRIRTLSTREELDEFEQYNIENIYIPSIYKTKDISDYVAKYGKEQSINLIKSLL